MKLSTIVFVLAGTSQAFLGSTKRNDVDINAESSAGSLLSRSMSLPEQWVKRTWDKAMETVHSISENYASSALRVKRRDLPDGVDTALLATGTGLFPTATGAPMPTGTSTSSTEQQGLTGASLRRRAKHLYPKDLSIDYRLAPKAPSRIKRAIDAAAAQPSGFKVKPRSQARSAN